MSRSGVEYRLSKAVSKAAHSIPSLKQKSVSPHTFRHTTAIHLLQSGVDISVVALWLGHENPATTHIYLEADLAMKKQALEKLENPQTKRMRFKPSDNVLAFLDSL
jgi:integrase/recombinase XerD